MAVVRSLGASDLRQDTGGAVASYPRTATAGIRCERAADGALVETDGSEAGWLASTSGTSKCGDGRRWVRSPWSLACAASECADGVAWTRPASLHSRDGPSDRARADPSAAKNTTAATSAAMIRGHASARRDGKRETGDRSSVFVELAMIRFVNLRHYHADSSMRAHSFRFVTPAPSFRPHQGWNVEDNASHSAGGIRQHGSRVTCAGTSH